MRANLAGRFYPARQGSQAAIPRQHLVWTPISRMPSPRHHAGVPPVVEALLKSPVLKDAVGTAAEPDGSAYDNSDEHLLASIETVMSGSNLSAYPMKSLADRVEAKKLKYDRAPSPDQRKKDNQHESFYIHVPTCWSPPQSDPCAEAKGSILYSTSLEAIIYYIMPYYSIPYHTVPSL